MMEDSDDEKTNARSDGDVGNQSYVQQRASAE